MGKGAEGDTAASSLLASKAPLVAKRRRTPTLLSPPSVVHHHTGRPDNEATVGDRSWPKGEVVECQLHVSQALGTLRRDPEEGGRMATGNSSYPDADVVLLSSTQYQRAMQEVLEQSGYTFEQLQEQAVHDEFETERARLTWLMVKD